MRSRILAPQSRARGVTAVLGPTNTGKTHLAIERMLGHSSGMIGLPLRLLAREVYSRIVERAGADSVALITGEEKIKPANPRYWVATVEAMPKDLDVAFVAVDEIQLAGDLDRGHVFTDCLLNRRGREETLVIGSMIMRPLVEALLPGANIVSRPRLSNLSFAGEKKLTRLPPRSAIVAFSVEEVYAIAELIRRQRGGAAVVMGALSPRTRNAQVELFQSGDVDYIIATDAIGMGLNLDIHHVAFASDRKYDGHHQRRLTTSEFGQIAGRAGRHLRDGTFGTSGRCGPFEPELIEKLENHVFEPMRLIQWRNPDLDTRSVNALRESLAVLPGEQGLARAPRAEDEIVFEIAAHDPDVRQHLGSPEGVAKLWEVCALPDYRKISYHGHAELAGQIFRFIRDEKAIPDDWFRRQINLCERFDGDIDTLSARIAQIRTWTFCANRDWLRDPLHWQGETRAIEDKLSDALHEKLTARFVDRRTSVLMRRLRENASMEAEVSATGDVTVEGQPVGRLEGFRFTPEAGATGPEAKALAAAALKALAGEIEARATKLAAAPDESFTLALDGSIRFIGEPVAKLQAGDKVLAPRFLILADEQLTGGARDSVDARLTLWLAAHLRKLLGPLLTLETGEGLEGIGRGIAYQLAENLGVLDRTAVQNDVKSLDQAARGALRKLGVRFGAYHIITPQLLKPAPRALAAQLWVLKQGGVEAKGLDDIANLAASGRTSIPVDEAIHKALYRAAGFRVCGPRALRVDILERLADLIRPAIAFRPGQTPGAPPPGAYMGDGFTITGAMTSLAGCAGEDFGAVLKALGYRTEKRPPLGDIPIVAVVVAQAAPVAAAEGEDAVAAPVVNDGTPLPADEPVVVADSEAAGESTPEAEPVAAEVVTAPEAEIPATPDPEPLVMEAAPEIAAETPTEAPLAAIIEAGPEAIALDGEAAGETEAAAPAPAPEMIDVWRPNRFERPERQRFERNRRPQRAATAEGVEGAPAPDATGQRPPRENRPGQKPWQRRDQNGAPREPRADGPRQDGPRPEGQRPDGQPPAQQFRRDDRPRAEGDRPPRDDRPNRNRNDRPRSDGSRSDGQRGDKPRFDKPRFDNRGGQQQQERPREKVADPLSPFAQLAALKAKLEGKT
ncbi:MAG: helicase-related protein [Beijerinckiaceae bacterium]